GRPSCRPGGGVKRCTQRRSGDPRTSSFCAACAFRHRFRWQSGGIPAYQTGPRTRFSGFGLSRVSSETHASPRMPRVFNTEEIAEEPDLDKTAAASGVAAPRRAAVERRHLTASDIGRGFRFGSILFSAMAALASLALGLWFTRFVSVALERRDWVGWV